MKNQSTSLLDAAVLVPLFRGVDGALEVVIVRRSDGGVHGGQLAFPGGKRTQTDHSLLETALRETREEIGVDTRAVEILEQLPTVETWATGFRIHPFLARLTAPRVWRREEREIAEILEVRVTDLVRPEAHGEETKWFRSWPRPRRVPFYRVGVHKLWGATYRILHPLLPRLAAQEWSV